jgi:hypothetical protein
VPSRARTALAALAALVAVLAVAGCVSVPSAGPVLPYPVAQQTSGQNAQNLQEIAAPPGYNWKPNEIVTGFLTAAAAIGNQQVAKAYLTPSASKHWKPSWSAYVYQTAPDVENPSYQSPTKGSQRGGKSGAKGSKQAPEPVPVQATVEVDGKISASLSGTTGTYAVPSSSAPVGQKVFDFRLVKIGGQWRIATLPTALLLTPDQFAVDYELRNLYFFDPNDQYLVPDPVYVPLQATTTSLINGLVTDLISPQKDWLAEATQSAFPVGTKIIGSVTLAGNTAAVNLGGAIATAPNQRTLLAQVSAQLLWTLVGSGQGGSQVQSVELLVNGQAKYPGNSQGIAAQHEPQAAYLPATGTSSTFYYVDSAGYLCSRASIGGKQVQIAKIGTGYSQIAVSPDGKYVAALRNASLYIGSVDGPLVKRQGSGYATISWDPTDNLWTTNGGQVITFRADVSANSPEARPITAYVPPPDGGLISAVRIAPDGVRVAIIINSDELAFGAIVWQQGARPGLAGAVRIDLSPFNVSDLTNAGFTAVTWYGPNDVITLDGTGSTLTEYPVNGGTPTSQSLDQPVDSITASSGPNLSSLDLIAGVAKGGMFWAPTLTGAWVPVTGKGISPTYPG